VEEPEPPKEEEMIAQEKVEDEPPPDEPKPADEPPPITTGLTGDGPGMAGLGAYQPGQGTGSGGIGGGGRGGSKYGHFASQVQNAIAAALRNHSKTRNAAFSVKARVWADSSGRIVRLTLENSTGDAAVDQALKSEVLTGLQLSQPPPADMPMPIVMRLNARKPGSLASNR
jgi:hypothetical protein